MSELSILELETEHADLLPEREALSLVHGGGHNHVHVTQIAVASADGGGGATITDPLVTATNTAVVIVA